MSVLGQAFRPPKKKKKTKKKKSLWPACRIYLFPFRVPVGYEDWPLMQKDPQLLMFSLYYGLKAPPFCCKRLHDPTFSLRINVEP